MAVLLFCWILLHVWNSVVSMKRPNGFLHQIKNVRLSWVLDLAIR